MRRKDGLPALRPRIPPHVRMLDHIEQVTESGCWIWMGYLNDQGYAIVYLPTGGKTHPARGHRVMYEALRGPVPAGLELDHVKERCSSRACVNPWHLEAVTHRENMLRGQGAGGQNARKTNCRKCGGPLIRTYGRARRCHPCDRSGQRIRYAARKAGTLFPSKRRGGEERTDR